LERRMIYGWLGRALLFFLSGLLFLELVFRFVFPADQRPSSMRVDDGIMLFDTTTREGFTSIGRVPLQKFHWRINDQGWNSLQDYLGPEERDRPLVAVIGDSHVENLQSDVDESIASHLQTLLGDACLVYGFGKADQSLLQDLLLMEYVDSLYSPDTWVIVLGGDVVRRSIMPDPSATYSYLVPADTGFTVAPPAPREPSGIAGVFLQSALIRYLTFNTRLELFPLFSIPEDYRSLNADLPPERVDELMPEAADYILRKMSDNFGGRGVLMFLNFFVTRYRIYDAIELRLSGDLVEPEDYRLLLEMAPEYPGIQCTDSREAFQTAWEEGHRRFESPDGKHLNGYGNRILAEDIYDMLRSSGNLDGLLR